MKKKLLFISSLLTLIIISIIYLYANSSDYLVEVTRKSQDLYKVDNTKIWIKTRYCYEYSYNEKAILKYSGYGYNKGTIIFNNGKKYDVEEIYEGVEVKRGTIGLTRNGDMKELELVLIPTELN